MREKLKLGVLVSGYGSNLQAIIDAIDKGKLDAEIRIVISNVDEAHALERAKKHGVPSAVIPHKDFASRELFEKEIVRHLENAGVEIVVLAGFMRVLTPAFVRRFAGKILNIHPALLPDFPGTDAIERAWKAGVKETGVTVHIVDEGVDTGPILLQKKVPVEPGESLESLAKKIHAVEHQLYPEAIQKFTGGSV